MTRIAVLSDIHGNLPALQAVVADAHDRGCNVFANLGDIVSGPLWQRETADYLMALNWPTIAGNHERQVLTDLPERMGASDAFARQECTNEQLKWLASLPSEMELGGAWCTHARPGNDHEYLLETVEASGAREATVQEIVFRLAGRKDALLLDGHSHLQRLVDLPGNMRIANPGSVGLPAYSDNRPYPHVMESGSICAQYLVLEQGRITFAQVAYDHEAAAARADANGRPDWAIALPTGKAA
jgi:predicted phosphodiesterase